MMNFQTIVFGRILSGGRITENKKILNALDTNQTFPSISSQMFNVTEMEDFILPTNQVITFGTSYKQVENDLTCWIMKFEAILKSLDFVTAKVQVETDSYGTYDFFWLSTDYNYRDHCDEYYEEMALYCTPKWYFGVGKRNMWGALEDADSEYYLKDVHRFIYPFRIVEKDINILKQLYYHVGQNKVLYISDLPVLEIDKDRFLQLLTFLKIQNMIEFKMGIHPQNLHIEEPYFMFKSDIEQIFT